MTTDETRNSRKRLPLKLLAAGALSVMVAQLAIGAPSLANVRLNWLKDRLAAAYTVAQVLQASPNGAMPDSLARELLDDIGARSVAVTMGSQRLLLASADALPLGHDVDNDVDVRDRNAFAEIAATGAVLLHDGRGAMRVVGPAPPGGEFLEMVIDEALLRGALLRSLANLLLMSALTAGIVTLLLYLALPYLRGPPLHRPPGTTS